MTILNNDILKVGIIGCGLSGKTSDAVPAENEGAGAAGNALSV